MLILWVRIVPEKLTIAQLIVCNAVLIHISSHLFIHSVCNDSMLRKGTSLSYKGENNTINKWHDRERCIKYTKRHLKIMHVIKT